MLPSLHPVSVTVEYDVQAFTGEIMLFLVANTNSLGGFEKLAPNALVDDGYFDLIILKKTNLAKFLRLATAALRGTHLEDERTIYTQAKKINVTPNEKMLLNIDGEYGGELPGEIINLKQHIPFIVSQEFIEHEKEIRAQQSEKQQLMP